MFRKMKTPEQDGYIKISLALRNPCKGPEKEEIKPDLSSIPKKLVIAQTI